MPKGKEDQTPRHPYYEQLHDFLDRWRDEYARTPLANLYQFRRFRTHSIVERHQLLRNTIVEMLKVLKGYSPDQADVIIARFMDGLSVIETRNKLPMTDSTLYKLQAAGIDWLATHLGELESDARSQIEQQYKARLEAPTNSELFGVDQHLFQVVAKLSGDDAQWIVSLEGIGGIGKTALANVVMRHLIDLPNISSFVDFAWVTARHAHLDLGGAIQLRQRPALTSAALVERLVAQLTNQHASLSSLPPEQQLSWLQRRLKEEPHLITIDNLETVIDLETLLPLLQQLSNPTRFLLTSRIGLDNLTTVATYKVQPLTEADSLRLIRHEAKNRDVPALIDASDARIRPIYKIVGGNPLALRLVTGLLATDTLANVLDDLKQARGEAVENLYEYIYLNAYRALKTTERSVWLELALLMGPLASAAMLAQCTGIAEAEVREILRKLVRKNLIDVHGSDEQRSYLLHPLTRTFLEQQIAKWGKGNGASGS